MTHHWRWTVSETSTKRPSCMLVRQKNERRKNVVSHECRINQVPQRQALDLSLMPPMPPTTKFDRLMSPWWILIHNPSADNSPLQPLLESSPRASLLYWNHRSRSRSQSSIFDSFGARRSTFVASAQAGHNSHRNQQHALLFRSRRH
jgi:hypothetical protein